MDQVVSENIEYEIKELIRNLCPGDASAMKNESNLTSDLGYHSLALVELSFAIEDKYDLDPIDQASAQKIQTVQSIIDFVSEKLKES